MHFHYESFTRKLSSGSCVVQRAAPTSPKTHDTISARPHHLYLQPPRQPTCTTQARVVSDGIQFERSSIKVCKCKSVGRDYPFGKMDDFRTEILSIFERTIRNFGVSVCVFFFRIFISLIWKINFVLNPLLSINICPLVVYELILELVYNYCRREYYFSNYFI